MLNQKDRQILKELDLDSRQSVSQIAKKVRVSKEVANYSIKKLEKEKVIDSYFSVINYFKLGSNIFKLLIRYKNIGEKGEAKMIKWLEKKEEVIWIGRIEGKWNLVISIRENNLEKIYEFLQEFNGAFSTNIGERQLLISYELNWLSEKYLYDDEKEVYCVVLKQGDEKVKIDKIDEKLIEMLEGNARIPLIDLSGKVGLTAEAVAKRIKELIKKKVISRFKLRTNHSNLGKGYHHIFISLSDFSKIDDLVNYYKKSKRCVFIMRYHGVYDLHLEMVSESEEEFREIIKELRESFGNFISDYQQVTVLQESIFR